MFWGRGPASVGEVTSVPNRTDTTTGKKKKTARKFTGRKKLHEKNTKAKATMMFGKIFRMFLERHCSGVILPVEN